MTVYMRSEIRDLWADALESGEYQQTTKVLTRLGDDGKPIGYCCLGVFCDLAVKAGVIGKPEVTNLNDDDNQPIPCLSYGHEDGEDGTSSETDLPTAVANWAGLHYIGGHGVRFPASDPVLFDEQGVDHSAATWNDTEHATFAQIAAMVRRIPTADEPVGAVQS